MPSLKLSDAQRVVLAAAGSRQSGLVLPLPKSLASKPASASRVLASLISKDLVAERAARSGEPTWKGEADERTTLEVTSAGLAAIGLGEAVETEAASPKERVAPKDPDARGRATPAKGPRSKAGKPSAPQSSSKSPKASSKLGVILAALRQRRGATIDELVAATGWQAHSVRGAISGALKKKLSLNVVAEPVEKRGRVYRIEDSSAK